MRNTWHNGKKPMVEFCVILSPFGYDNSDVELTITVQDQPDPEEIRTVISKLVGYNESHVGKRDSQPLVILIRDSNDEIVGGLISNTNRGWLFISQLWVSESLRGQGYGRKMMMTAEKEAKKRNCHHIWLDTFSFQAPDFYQRLGYQIFGVLEDYPIGHKRYFLHKQIYTDAVE